MDEIHRIAKEYYLACIDLMLFGFKGIVFLFIGSPFIFLGMYISGGFDQNNPVSSVFGIVPQVIGMIFWRMAAKEYDSNLIRRLNDKLGVKGSTKQELKLMYLRTLTSHIGNSLFESLQNIDSLEAFHKKNRPFSIEGLMTRFFSFVYDPESKNRILSLSLYMVSLVGILVAVKHADQDYIFQLISQLTLSGVAEFILVSAFVITIVYFVFMVPIAFIFGYLISPLLRRYSNNILVVRYFLHELSKYAFVREVTANKSMYGVAPLRGIGHD